MGFLFHIRNPGGYLCGFIMNSTLKILVPYSIALLAFSTSYELLNGESYFEYILHTPFVSWLPYSWFVFVILGGYYAFWIVFRVSIDVRKKIVLFALILLAYQIVGHITNIPRVYYASVISMPLGMVYCLYETQIISLQQKSKHIIPILVVLVSVLCLYILNAKLNYKDLNPLFTCPIFAIIMSSIIIKKPNGLVVFLQSISYEMYLFQGIILTVFKASIPSNNTIILLIIILMADLVLAYIFNRLLVRKCLSYLKNIISKT